METAESQATTDGGGGGKGSVVRDLVFVTNVLAGKGGRLLYEYGKNQPSQASPGPVNAGNVDVGSIESTLCFLREVQMKKEAY